MGCGWFIGAVGGESVGGLWECEGGVEEEGRNALEEIRAVGERRRGGTRDIGCSEKKVAF